MRTPPDWLKTGVKDNKMCYTMNFQQLVISHLRKELVINTGIEREVRGEREGERGRARRERVVEG